MSITVESDQALLARLALEIREDLDAQRKNGERYVRIGQRMERSREVYERGGGTDGLKWVARTFVVGERQVRKYLRVGERLVEADVLGSTLCLDGLVQVALAPVPLRGLLRRLGEAEGLGYRCLSAGRRAGAPLLEEGGLPEALAALEQAARAAARAEDGEDQEGASKDGKEGAQPEAAPDARKELILVARVLQRAASRLRVLEDQVMKGTLDRGGLDLAAARDVVAAATEARLVAEALLGAQADEAEARVRSEADEAEARVRSEAAEAEAIRARSLIEGAAAWREEFTPVVTAAKALSYEDKNELGARLGFLVRGDDVEEERAALTRLGERLLAVASPPPEALVGRWLAKLFDADWDRRGTFALWFLRVAGLDELGTVLRDQAPRPDLPPRLAVAVALLVDRWRRASAARQGRTPPS